ncbi:MAG: putative S-layer protein, partial [Nanoarchaeota archaeon]|nr:putative S-layer protein [Nanoarchaeota archaeon]
MRNKLFTLLSLSILTFVVLISCVSAASLSVGAVVGNESTISQEDGEFSFTFELTNTGVAADINWSSSTASAGDVDFSYSHNSIADGSTTAQTITITVTGDFDDSYYGTISGTIVANPSGAGGDAEVTYSITVTEVPKPEEVDECILTGSTGNLKLSIEDFSVEKGYGDDNEWFPLDEVQVEVEVENKGDEKIRNVAIGWGLYNVDTEEWVIDDTESDFNLGDDTKETVYINFKLEDVSDFEDGSDYVFYVWAEGEDNNLDSKPDTCVWASDDISIEIESDFVVLDNFEYSETISCGSTVQIMADVYNIGDSDQDDVSV